MSKKKNENEANANQVTDATDIGIDIGTDPTKNPPLPKYGVLFIPPGWLVAGTLHERGEYVVLTDVVWIETIHNGHSAFDLSTTKDPKKVISACWPLLDGTRVRLDSVYFMVPMLNSVKTLAQQRDVEALKGVK